jgi:hypothetical protein
MKDLTRPVDVYLDPSTETQPVPAVLFDLSAGGMCLLSFVPVDLGSRIMTQIILPGLNMKLIEGKVMWTLEKGRSYRLGITFTKIDKSDVDTLAAIADDFVRCDAKIAAGDNSVCVDNCRYFALCEKPQKKHSSQK